MKEGKREVTGSIMEEDDNKGNKQKQKEHKLQRTDGMLSEQDTEEVDRKRTGITTFRETEIR